MTETPVLKPMDEPDEKQFSLNLTETEARYLLNQITDICAISQASINLPETTQIQKSSNFYVEEIFRTLKEFNLIIE
jgi:hypothetical protein